MPVSQHGGKVGHRSTSSCLTRDHQRTPCCPFRRRDGFPCCAGALAASPSSPSPPPSARSSMTTAPDRSAPARTDKTTQHFDENAQHIAKRQYLQGNDGDISGMFWRIADWVAGAEAPEARQGWAQQYYDLMAEKKFCPGGRVLAGAGTQHGNVLNCFVQGATEHDPSSFEGVMEVAKKLALVTKVGGGNGVNLDVYRPRAQSSRSDNGVRGWVYMSAEHADVQDFIEGLMRPPTQP
ncbi:MAG TPA: ribonucleoside-diphosphate reductase, partial [Deinococcus radiodurans]|nr:ribonucleoside-diphosphate reductase [Deinococcus radiodurans]